MKQIDIVDRITTKYPDLLLKAGDTYVWSPGDRTVFYKADDTSQEGVWALLHESGHALLGHTNYYSDFELVRLEMEAWEKAKEVALQLSSEHGAMSNEKSGESRAESEAAAAHSNPQSPVINLLTIDDDHIQDCLDSYRNWLHKRSLCPDCHLSSVQINAKTYSCIFCHKKWNVTAERFCRPYRRAVHT